MVIGVKRDLYRDLALGQIRQMQPWAVEPPDLGTVDIDMGVALARLVVAAGVLRRKGEAFGLYEKVMA